MKRIAFLALAASLVVSCEKSREPTAPVLSDLTGPSTATTFSGQATVVQATILNLDPVKVGDTGPLPASGGARESSLLTVSKDQTGGLLAAEVVHATTVGQGNASSAEASVSGVSGSAAGHDIQADVLRSQAQATCDGAGGASASGSSDIAGLVIDGQAIVVTGQPNQTIDLPDGSGRIVINEQSGSASGSDAGITVNALHVTVFNPLGGTPLADVVISSAHADISCAGCAGPVGDFVTGGGWITGTPSGTRANFGVAGGIKNGAFWGHLTYIDHGGPKVQGTGVTAYTVTGDVSRHIEGTAEIDGVSGTYKVDVTDAGEPGRDDTFSIELSTGYRASGTLRGGNIQLHAKPGPCP